MNSEEFEDFFHKVYPQLVRYARTHHPSAAEDLASRALEDIWTKGESAPADLRAFNRLRKFTFSILRGHISHHSRAERARLRREQAFASEQSLVAGQRDVLDHLLGAATPEWMRELREQEQHLLILFANGYKPAEIAVMLGIRASAVSARLQRVKNKARKLIGTEDESDQ